MEQNAEPDATHAERDEVTDAINAALDELGGDQLDPFVAEAARRILEKMEW